jgi:hypothetical protein
MEVKAVCLLSFSQRREWLFNLISEFRNKILIILRKEHGETSNLTITGDHWPLESKAGFIL